MAVLGYLAKLKRGLGLAFGAIFCMVFPWIFSVFNTLSMGRVSMSHLLSFSRHQAKSVVVSSYSDSWWHHKFYDFSWINRQCNGWQGKKRDEDKDIKIWISQERKDLFRRNIKHFS